VNRWLKKTGQLGGETIGMEAMWKLAAGWYSDPRAATWRPRSRDESQAVIAAAGLTGEFWELPR
jgi:hypothetical protein